MAKPKRGHKPRQKKKGGGYTELSEDDAGPSTKRKGCGKNQAGKGASRGRPQQQLSSRKKKRGGKAGVRPYDDDDSFRETLQAEGSRTINEMASDGNCLFRSLSDQLFLDYGERHDSVRKEVCDFLEANEEDFKMFLILDEEEEDEDASSFEEYVALMREDGEWGGNLELVSAARLYRRDITVFSAAGAFSIASGHEEKSEGNILLSFHENDHYNSVRDRNVQNRISTKSFRSELGSKIDFPDAQSKRSDSKSDDGSERRPNIRRQGSGKKQRRNDPCSCGSGLLYKKCCLSVEKNQAKLSKWKAKHGIEEPNSGFEEERKEETIHGDFKVLKI